MKLAVGKWYIRSYEDADVAALVKYANNRKIWLMLTHLFPHPYTEEDARSWLDIVKHQMVETNFAISTADELIGTIGFKLFEGVHCKTAELGYWLGEPYWGQGIMTEAARAMTEYMFTHHNIVRIQACIFESNPGSVRVLEKNGFCYEGRLRKHVWKDEKLQDLLIYGILRHEWEQRNS
ncbi:GCN5-related N-acetyltransferase [Candidatus Vecturithrix granuli]|uniref:GCN5-related N-acetyltransferase n=1 Tax=Vecturithrix granuli TaxID=1499967 RepID=A0A081BTQ5_VECG1|nr:GCN5-related N-acetyltransferase [Candidatus Vecturithrix granuli]